MDVIRGLIGCVILAVGLSGCASNHNRSIISSFEAVTSGKNRETGAFNQLHTASVNGLLPFSALGEEYFFAGDRSVLSGVGVSSIDDPLRAEHTLTYALVREFPSDASLTDLEGIRGEITSSMALLIQVLRAKRELAAAETNSAPQILIDARKNYTNLVAQADAKMTNIVGSISKRNVLLFRWDTEKKRSMAGKLGSLFSSRATEEKAQHGFGLLAGLRTSHLYVGTDMVDDLAKSQAARSQIINQRMAVPTFTVGASNLLYFAEDDLSKEISAQLTASYTTLSSGAALVKAIDRIELEYVTKQLQKLSNIGIVEGSSVTKVHMIPMRYAAPAMGGEMIHPLAVETKGYTTIYSVLTRTSDLTRGLKRR